jgi:TM2 domain-containing membrane protein YozV
MSEKSRLVTLLMCLYFGIFGGHRFYVGKVGTGLIWLLTLGCLGIGFFVDLITILTGNFYDRNGKQVLAWVRAVDAEGKVLTHVV